MTTFKLSCENFQSEMSTGLLAMLETEQHADVTIAIDGKYLKAHQMVLSICSPYFNTLLQTNPCTHPIIILNDVKYHIMQQLLRFMYEGQIQIVGEDISSFMHTGQALQIKWLMNINNDHINTELNCVNVENESRNEMKRARVCSPTHSVGEKQVTKRPKTNEEVRIKQELHEEPPTNVQTYECNEIIEDETMNASEASELIDETFDEESSTSTSLQIDEALLPAPAIRTDSPTDAKESQPVTVTFFKVKQMQIMVERHSYSKHFSSRCWTRWRCSASHQKCRAHVVLTCDNHIHVKHEHNHSPVELQPASQVQCIEIYQSCDREYLRKLLAVKFLKATKHTIVLHNNHRYRRYSKCKRWTTWRCSHYFNGRWQHPCEALILLTTDNRIISRNKHNHYETKSHGDQPIIACEYYYPACHDYLQTI